MCLCTQIFQSEHIPPFEFTLHFKTFEFVVQHFPFISFFSPLPFFLFACFSRSMRKWQTKCVDRLWGKCFTEIFWIVVRQILNECLIYGFETRHDTKSINHRQIKLTFCLIYIYKFEWCCKIIKWNVISLNFTLDLEYNFRHFKIIMWSIYRLESN